MCDACKGLAFLELEGVTERQMEAARVLLCDDEESSEAKVERAIEDERDACDSQYEIVAAQHDAIGKKIEELRQSVGGLTLDPEQLKLLVEIQELVEGLPETLADAE